MYSPQTPLSGAWSAQRQNPETFVLSHDERYGHPGHASLPSIQHLRVSSTSTPAERSVVVGMDALGVALSPDGRFAIVSNDAELSQRLSHEVLPEMERLELELRRKLDDKNSDQVRSAGSETVPPGYSDAVADYFRKLSKGK